MTYTVTKHAQKRMAQRGIRHHDLDMLLAHADLEKDVGGQCTLLGLRRNTVHHLGLDDWMQRTAAIVSADNAIITVLLIHDSPGGRRYRWNRKEWGANHVG